MSSPEKMCEDDTDSELSMPPEISASEKQGEGYNLRDYLLNNDELDEVIMELQRSFSQIEFLGERRTVIKTGLSIEDIGEIIKRGDGLLFDDPTFPKDPLNQPNMEECTCEWRNVFLSFEGISETVRDDKEDIKSTSFQQGQLRNCTTHGAGIHLTFPGARAALDFLLPDLQPLERYGAIIGRIYNSNCEWTLHVISPDVPCIQYFCIFAQVTDKATPALLEKLYATSKGEGGYKSLNIGNRVNTVLFHYSGGSGRAENLRTSDPLCWLWKSLASHLFSGFCVTLTGRSFGTNAINKKGFECNHCYQLYDCILIKKSGVTLPVAIVTTTRGISPFTGALSIFDTEFDEIEEDDQLRLKILYAKGGIPIELKNISRAFSLVQYFFPLLPTTIGVKFTFNGFLWTAQHKVGVSSEAAPGEHKFRLEEPCRFYASVSKMSEAGCYGVELYQIYPHRGLRQGMQLVLRKKLSPHPFVEQGVIIEKASPGEYLLRVTIFRDVPVSYKARLIEQFDPPEIFKISKADEKIVNAYEASVPTV